MTLNELSAKFFSRPTVAPPTKMFIFTDEDSADNWVECMYLGNKDVGDAYELTAVFQSDFRMEYSIVESLCNAEVEHFYAVEADVLVVIVREKA